MDGQRDTPATMKDSSSNSTMIDFTSLKKYLIKGKHGKVKW